MSPESWDRARRVVLVVRERLGELYPDHFWLLTSLSRKRYQAQELLAQYRKRGKAEGHNELMDVLDPALSSASRPKTHYRGQPLKPGAKPEATTEAGVRPHNEVLFLLNLLGYEILHLGRVLKISRAGVASGISGATSGEAIDFRHQSRGDRLEAVVAEPGAGVLGAGIGDGGEIGPVEGTETVGISGRKVNLSAGDGLAGKWFMTGSIVLFLSRFSRIERGSMQAPGCDRIGSEALIIHVP